MAALITNPDDLVQPFHLPSSGMAGRLVRLGPVIDTILTRHAYAEPVSRALGDAITLAALIASGLKFDSRFTDGRFVMQTKTDGPLGFLVVHFDLPGRLRGYASIGKGREGEAISPGLDQGRLLGNGHFAMTIDPGGDLDSYQGIVPLDGVGLIDAAHTYFRKSEQLPTFIRIALARHNVDGQYRWRAGGLMLQHIPKLGGQPVIVADDDAEAHDASLGGEDDENWQRCRMLAQTVEDHELTDPTLPAERLLYRLFHEEGVRVTPPSPLNAECRCSRERIATFLQTFERTELEAMAVDDGRIEVRCEYCATAYRFSPDTVIADPDRGKRTLP